MRRRAKEAWRILDKDLRQQGMIERAGQHVARPLVAPALALIFLMVSAFLGLSLAGLGEGELLLVAASGFAGYMALNIGANDIGNNLGPVLGARAVPLVPMLAMAAMAEFAGAILAGGPVAETIGFGLIAPDTAQGGRVAHVMLAGLIAAGLWVNLATLISASVSTTHAIVGGIVGAGLVAFGPAAVDWPELLVITLVWIASPLIGGVLAAGILAGVRWRIEEVEDRRAAALLWVPRLMGVMAGAFVTYALVGLPGIGTARPMVALAAGAAAAVIVAQASRPACRRQVTQWPTDRRPSGKALRGIFRLPLVAAALLFSFAHGANDVSNAVGPLAAILHSDATPQETPGAGFAALGLGGLGIALGVLLFGPRLIRVVGSEITKLNPLRGFAVLLSAAVTATAASWAGLPVSSTHIALGGIFGIGFWREAQESRLARRSGGERGAGPPPEERRRRRLVRRSLIFTMIGAWTVTLPLSGGLAATIFLILDRLGG